MKFGQQNDESAWSGLYKGRAGEPADSAGSPKFSLVAGAPVKGETANRQEKSADHLRNCPASDWSALMGLAQEGNNQAYAQLLREIAPYLRSLAASRLSDPTSIEDAVQDILLTIHAVRHTYDPRRPFGPWLVTIAKRRIIDRLRQDTRRRSRETYLKPEHETFPGEQANIIEEQADHQALWKAIENLPRSQREAIRLLKMEEMSLKEASILSGMSITSLKVATHRALRNLRKKLASWEALT